MGNPALTIKSWPAQLPPEERQRLHRESLAKDRAQRYPTGKCAPECPQDCAWRVRHHKGQDRCRIYYGNKETKYTVVWESTWNLGAEPLLLTCQMYEWGKK